MRAAIVHLRLRAVVAGRDADGDSELGRGEEALVTVLDRGGGPDDAFVVEGLVLVPAPTDRDDRRIVDRIVDHLAEAVDQAFLIEGGEIDRQLGPCPQRAGDVDVEHHLAGRIRVACGISRYAVHRDDFNAGRR